MNILFKYEQTSVGAGNIRQEFHRVLTSDFQNY